MTTFTYTEFNLVEVLARFISQSWQFIRLDSNKPIDKGWSKRHTPSKLDIELVNSSGKVGLRTGEASGVVVVDMNPGADDRELEWMHTSEEAAL